MVNDLVNAPRPAAPIYVVSFFNPIVGLVIGATWMGKPGKDNRTFGKYCLFAAVGGFGVFLLIIVLVLTVYFGTVVAITPIMMLAQSP